MPQYDYDFLVQERRREQAQRAQSRAHFPTHSEHSVTYGDLEADTWHCAVCHTEVPATFIRDTYRAGATRWVAAGSGWGWRCINPGRPCSAVMHLHPGGMRAE